MNDNLDPVDVAIIGGGPVGIFSVFACGMQGLKCAMIDALDNLGGQCVCVYPEKDIYDIPGFPCISAKKLIDNLVEQACVFNPKIYLNSFVSSVQKLDACFCVDTMQNGEISKIYAKSIIIALGAGIFSPIKPNLENIEKFENIKYFIDDVSIFKGKNTAIVGGGDSAIDWAIMLSDYANKIYLVHRREHIRAHPASWNKVVELASQGLIDIKIPYSVSGLVEENDKFVGVDVVHNDGGKMFLELDYLLPCFGLKSDISFLNAWNLESKGNRVLVEPSTMRTSLQGVYAIGDCAYYQNKRKLILTGFAEAATCAQDIFSYIHPDRAPIIAHSTSIGVPK